MNNYVSISTISSPEFINLTPLDINPLMSKCEIKVLYLGNNRNGSSISRDVAIEMSKTLRGAPIVGYYRKDKGDFFDHGDRVTYDGDGIHFESLTQPYGFVSPDAQVWFQDFEEQEPNGKTITRTYLMTTGYLWTGQYEEAQQVLDDGGKPHSMELDEKSLSGYWAKEANEPFEFFIINDASFSKLCILGDDVEPCFEGSSITEPNVSKSFSLDNNFTHTLYQMMNELKEALEGGTRKVEDKFEATTEFEVENTEAEAIENIEITENIQDNVVETEATENEVVIENSESESTEFEKKEDDEEKNEDKEDGSESEEGKEDDEDKKKDYALAEATAKIEEMSSAFTALKAQYENLSKELESLKQYKAAIENKEKDALISEFFMLSDEDKQDVIENKDKYTLDEIKSKLAVLCFDKKVVYSKDNDFSKEVGVTVNVETTGSTTPAWLQAVDAHKKSN